MQITLPERNKLKIPKNLAQPEVGKAPYSEKNFLTPQG